ncbi:MAG: class I SAM-dependent methyltransferase [Ginsengibacter sp.]
MKSQNKAVEALNSSTGCLKINMCNEKKIVLFEKNNYDIYECSKCHLRISKLKEINNHLATVYSDDYFFAGGVGYPNYLEEKNELYNSGIRYAGIMSKYLAPGKVLDVGCAAGFYLKGFEKSGWECMGVEPNETIASYGRNELNLHIVSGDLESFQSDEKFDLINLIEVIGSFHDLNKAMEKVQQLLKTGGFVLVESWDHRSRIAQLFGKHWHEYCPPSVINWFSDKTLKELFEAYGFDLIYKGRPSKKIKGSHALEIVSKNTPHFVFKEKIFKFLNFTIGKITLAYPPLDLKYYIFKKM